MHDHTPVNVFARDAFDGRVFGVTGAAHGIGLATADALARLGAKVIVIDLNAPSLERARTQLDAAGYDYLPVLADVSDASAMQTAIDQALTRWGRLDGWVNNAYFSRMQLQAEQSEVDFVRAWEVNCLAAWRLSKLLLPHLAKQRGSIVNISSIMSQQTLSTMASYTSSKAALEGLTRALAVEFAEHQVRMNAILPGYILTYEGLNDYIHEPRETWPDFVRVNAEWLEFMTSRTQPTIVSGRPDDLAQSVLFLLSDASRFITGTTLVVDGGMSIDLRNPMQPNQLLLAEKYRDIKPMVDKLKAVANKRQV